MRARLLLLAKIRFKEMWVWGNDQEKGEEQDGEDDESEEEQWGKAQERVESHGGAKGYLSNGGIPCQQDDEAVIDEGEKGQLATVKYLFEMAAIFPASTDGSHATEDEDCLARTLLNRLDLPTEPVGRDEEDEPVRTAKSTTASGKDAGEKASDKQSIEKKSSEDATNEKESLDCSLSGAADRGEEEQ